MSKHIPEFHLEMKLRNNRLRRMREELGMSSPVFSKACGVSYGSYTRLECMHEHPVGKTGEWRPLALKIADFHGVDVEWLFPESVQAVKHSVISRELGACDMGLLLEPPNPEQLLLEAERNGIVAECVDGTVDGVLVREWVVEDRTLDEIGKRHPGEYGGSSRIRTSQRIDRAMGRIHVALDGRGIRERQHDNRR